jgi:hypothetical protein
MDTTLHTHTPWTVSRKVGFLFFCCHFILYTFPFPFNDIPFNREIDKINEHILGWYYAIWGNVQTFWHWVIPKMPNPPPAIRLPYLQTAAVTQPLTMHCC